MRALTTTDLPGPHLYYIGRCLSQLQWALLKRLNDQAGRADMLFAPYNVKGAFPTLLVKYPLKLPESKKEHPLTSPQWLTQTKLGRESNKCCPLNSKYGGIYTSLNTVGCAGLAITWEFPKFRPLFKDPECNVVTMSEYLRLPFLSGMTIEAGGALTEQDVIPQHTTTPLSDDEPVPGKTDSQQRVEASDPKIVA
ncbi:hypothetical protein Tco_0833739 [Tanacetum coccineum]